MSNGLAPLKFQKNWNAGTTSREENWDEIANKAASFGNQTNNNFKQLGLDIGGTSFDYNGIGRGTQTTSIIDRITTLESQSAIVGSRNLGLDLSSVNKIKIFGAGGDALSSSNVGLVTFNSSANPGELITRNITANMEVTLTGAHWGLDTYGDLTNFVLWVFMIDTGSSAIMGVTAQGGRNTIANTDCFTSPGSVVSLEDALVTSAPASTYNITYIAALNADFDDTGNAGGENYWTVQSAIGDIIFTPAPIYTEGTFVF